MIRLAQEKDLDAINNIYNQAVSSKFETADTAPTTLEERALWFNQHPFNTLPVYVYEHNGIVAAWLSFSPYRAGRKALRFTTEISYYVHADFKRLQIGSQLIAFALNKAKELDFKSVFAIVLDKNLPSINLLKKYNFAEWAHLPGIADFEGVECGHFYYGIRL
jgi:phosphinothricin acetyltransferase